MAKASPLIAAVVIALTLACERADDDGPAPAPPASAAGTPWPVEVVLPEGLGKADSGMKDASGQAIEVGCATCHESHAEASYARTAEALTEWHLDLTFEHGALPCFSCHVTEDRSLLKLADGEQIPFAEVQRLCGQCHGPQARDWRRGSHGGMQGYWDRTKGPRKRASCVSCHNAHAPAWPQVEPVFKPKDRFLGTDAHQ